MTVLLLTRNFYNRGTFATLLFSVLLCNVQFFSPPGSDRHTPKKILGRKTCKIWPDFRRPQSSAANISETDEDIQNPINMFSTAIPPASGETSPVKFGPVTLEI